MKTLDIYYVRHGEPDYSSDTLTELGHKQAEKTAQVLKKIEFDKVFSSSLGRAVETAKHTTEKTGNKIFQIDWIREDLAWKHLAFNNEENFCTWIYNQEKYMGRMFELQDDPDWYLNTLFPGEIRVGIKEMAEAVDEWLLEMNIFHDRETKKFISRGKTPQTIAVFAHEGASTLFISSILDMSYAKYLTHHFPAELASITHIRLYLDDVKGAMLISYNQTSHLK